MYLFAILHHHVCSMCSLLMLLSNSNIGAEHVHVHIMGTSMLYHHIWYYFVFIFEENNSSVYRIELNWLNLLPGIIFQIIQFNCELTIVSFLLFSALCLFLYIIWCLRYSPSLIYTSYAMSRQFKLILYTIRIYQQNMANRIYFMIRESRRECAYVFILGIFQFHL